jgi:hypothetical protein
VCGTEPRLATTVRHGPIFVFDLPRMDELGRRPHRCDDALPSRNKRYERQLGPCMAQLTYLYYCRGRTLLMSLLHDFEASGEGGRLQPRSHLQLGEDVLDMGANRVERDVQLGSDVLAAGPFRQ